MGDVGRLGVLPLRLMGADEEEAIASDTVDMCS